MFILTVPARGADNTVPHSNLPHSEFVRQHMDSVVESLLDGFTPNRTRPVAAAAVPAGFLDSLLESDMRAALARRGILVRRAAPDDGINGDDSWAVFSRVEGARLELSEPMRHSFLGKIWLKRSFHIRAALRIEDRGDSSAVWEASIDTSYTDWIQKRDLVTLSDRPEIDLAPIAPTTAWERAQTPAVTGGLAGALAILFLVLR